MTSTRVLIVEPDHSFGLSLASLFQDDGFATRVAGSAGEAELEIALRRPDLIVLRAELPDLSGFSLCARLRHDRATERLPVILYSSETAPGALAEHASTPWAANGYLAMPLDTSALQTLSRRILAANEVIESADDAVIEEAEPWAATPPPAALRITPVTKPAFTPVPEGPPPPPVPRRPVRNALTEEDRLLVNRIFGSIAERRDALLAEAGRHRPPPRRELLQTADGRLQLLRDDLKAREAQIAQLAELWEVREREVEYAGEWLHEKDVELQGLKGKVEDLLGRLAEAREVLAQKEREHGASVDGLLFEKVSQEKELIEAIASGERRAHEAARAHEALKRSLEEAIAGLEEERRALGERLAGLEEQKLALGERLSAVEAELAAERERAGELEGEIAEQRSAAEAASAEAARHAEELGADVAERDRLLGAAKRENERLQGQLTEARHEQMLLQSELNAVTDRARARAEELEAQLATAVRERDEARAAGAAATSTVAPLPGEDVPAPEDPPGGPAQAGDVGSPADPAAVAAGGGH
jgi:ParB family chromosome partitioning protein